MTRPELLSPAGDLNKAKYALNYGADAIYLGAKAYSLRARASNFDFEEIKEIIEYAHALNKKVYLVTNIICHNAHLDGFNDFINKIISLKPDGFICADPFIINE
ncbi:MAG: U32 family peptidase, partial [Mycoplasmoidaceae bacterium]|nr:U32 family peptidase [Mycoplasmoidaceae bacterium]